MFRREKVPVTEQAELKQAEERLEWTERMNKKGYVSATSLAAERAKLESVKIRQAAEHLKRAEERRRVGKVSDEQVEGEREALKRLKAGRAQLDLARGKDRLEWAERMHDKGYVSKTRVNSERIHFLEAKLALELVTRGKDAVSLQGVVRDRETGKPIPRIQISEPSSGKITTVDETGRFLLTGLPAQKKYTLVALPLAGQPFLISSKVVERSEGKEPGPIEIDLTREIPIRVKVVDATTHKPIPGSLSYFPVSPNDPLQRGIMGCGR